MKNVMKLTGIILVCLALLLACRFPIVDEPQIVEALSPTNTARPAPQENVQPQPTAVRATQTSALAAPTAALTAKPPLPTETQAAAPVVEAYGSIARQHLAVLADQIGLREAGSLEEVEAAEYIAATLAGYGYQVETQPFTFEAENGDELDSANVIAVKAGLSDREIIVGAHYDSTGRGDGADDNASGVAVLLEAAARLQDVETPYTIRFVAFGAEEVDLDGSRYYVKQMGRAEIQNTLGMINLDSVIAGDLAYVYGDTGAGSLLNWIVERAAVCHLELDSRPAADLDTDGELCDCADYGPFQQAGIPFAYFEATNWNLGDEDGMTQVDLDLGMRGEIRHTRYDTLEYLEETFPGRIDQYLNLFVTLLCDTLTLFR